jgi:hypothetical protein
MSTQTSQASQRTPRRGFGPRRLAQYATGHPKRVLAVSGADEVLETTTNLTGLD